MSALPLPPWLDRIWLWLIALSALLLVPIWLILWSERLGAVTLAILIVVFIYALRRA